MNKVYNSDLVDSIRNRTNIYDLYSNPDKSVSSYIHEVENPQHLGAPDSYDAGDYLLDAYNTWDLKRNETNYSTSLGEFQRIQALVADLDDAEQYLQNQELIKNIQQSPEQFTKEQMQEAFTLEKELKPAYERAVKENKLLGDTTSQINQISESKNSYLEEQKESLLKAEKYSKRVNEIIAKDNITDYFKLREQTGVLGDTLDSYLYKLPGIFGSSSASLGANAVSLVSSLAANIALTGLAAGATVGTGGAAAPAAGTAVAASYANTARAAVAVGAGIARLASGLYSASEENKAEVYDNMKSRVIKESIDNGTYQSIMKEARDKYSKQFGNAGVTDDKLMDLILSKEIEVNNSLFNKGVRTALTGVEDLYNRDMLKVAGTETLQTALEIVPLGYLAKAGKLGKLGKGIQTVSDKTKAFTAALGDKIESAINFGMEKSIEGMAGRRMRNKIVDLTGRVILGSLNEMGEESVQYLNGQEYIAGKYDGNQPNWLTNIASNIGETAKSYYSFLSPWDTNMISDEEWLENARSGAVLGLFNLPNIASVGVKSYQIGKQYQTDKWLANHATSDMFAEKDDVAKGILYTDKAIKGQRGKLMDAFDALSEIGIDGIEQKDIDQEKARANRIMNYAESNTIKENAKRIGLTPGTKEYNTYVSMYDYYSNRYTEALTNYLNKALEADRMLNSEDVTNAFLAQYDRAINLFGSDLMSGERMEGFTNVVQFNAKLQGYKNALANLDKQDEDLSDLYSRFGIKYNKSDLNTARSILKREIATMEKKAAEAGITGKEEIPSIQKQLIDIYESMSYANIDLERSRNDLNDITLGKLTEIEKEGEGKVEDKVNHEERVRRKINKYWRIQKQNEELELNIADNFRTQNQPETQEESTEDTVKPETEPTAEVKTEDTTKPEATPNVAPTPRPEPVKPEPIDTESLPPMPEDGVIEDLSDKKPVDTKVNDDSNVQEENSAEEGDGSATVNPTEITEGIESAETDKKIELTEDQASLIKSEIDQLREKIQKDRSEIYDATIKAGKKGRSKIEKTRDQINAARMAQGKPLANYTDEELNQVPSREFHEENPIGSVVNKATKIIDELTKEVDELVKSIFSQAYPESAWKFRYERNPYFVLQDVDALYDAYLGDQMLTPEQKQQASQQELDAINLERKSKGLEETSINELPAKPNFSELIDQNTANVFEAYAELSNALGELEDAISDLNTNRINELTDVIENKQLQLRSTLDSLSKKAEEKKEEQIDPSTLNTFYEKGHVISPQGNRDFIELSGNPDFVSASTYDFDVENGNVFIIFHYKGKDIKVQLANDAQTSDLAKKIEAYKRLQQSDPTIKLVPIGIKKTNGRIKNGEDKKLTDVDILWRGEKDPYKIDPQSVIISVGTGAYGRMSRRGTDTYNQANASMGGIYWQAKLYHPETGKYERVSVRLKPAKIGEHEGLADLILQLYSQLNQYTFTTKDGLVTPFDPQRLLNFIVYNGAKTAVTDANANNYTQAQLEQKRNKQLYIAEDGSLIIGTTAFNLTTLNSDPKVRQLAIELLNDFNFRIAENNLYNNWGSDELSEDSIFYGLKSWFKLNNEDKITLVPGAVEFTKEMVGLGDRTDHKNGISVLGYYISNGLIKTDFDGFRDAKVYLQDIDIVREQPVQEDAVEQEVKSTINIQDLKSADDLSAWFDQEFAPFTNIDDEETHQLIADEEAEIKRIIKKYTGLDESQVEIVDSIIGVSQAGFPILAGTWVDSIKIYNNTVSGIAYHEAWHRISNILMQPNKREALFNKYREKYGKELTDKQIDEILAEKFRDFMLGVDAGTSDYRWLKHFTRLASYIKAFAKLKDFTLMKLYYNIIRGKFAKNKVSLSNIDRFKQIYSKGYAAFTYRGKEFNTITSGQALNRAVDGLVYLLFKMPIQITDANGNTTTTVFEIDDYSKVSLLQMGKLLELLNSSNNPVYKELADNFDVVQKLIQQKLSLFQVKLIDKTQRQDIEDADSGETGKINMDDYTKASYEFDPLNNAPAEVKFFFSTVPEFEASPNGTWQLAKDPLTKFPRFVNPRLCWNIVINDLHEAETIQQLEDKINQLANTNPLYIGVQKKLQKLIDNSKSSIKNVSTSAEATLTKILVTIHSNKNNFLTVKATTNEDGTHNLDIIDNTVENKSRALPAMWSQTLFLNGGVFRADDNGNITYTENGRHTLSTAVKVYNNLVQVLSTDGILKQGNKEYDLHDPVNMNRLLDYTMRLLNMIGILVDLGTLQEMLNRPEYEGATGYDRIQKFLHSSVAYYGGMRSIFKRIQQVLNQRDNINTIQKMLPNGETQDISAAQIYNDLGFVKELANAMIKYHSTFDSLQNIGAGNNLVYGSSQNNFVTDRVNEMNNDIEFMEELSTVPYLSSSLLLEEVLKGTKLRTETYINFRTTNVGDEGSDYHGITDLEDYVSKLTFVLNDRVIFPTIADKKTYHVISGVKLPHERLQFTNGNRFYPRYVRFGNATVNRLLQYSLGELRSIEECMSQLDFNSPNFIPENQRIKNYHTGNKYQDSTGKKHKVDPNGMRFRFLTGIYEIDGNGKINYVSFNDPKLSAKLNLEIAKKRFFNRSLEEQLMLMNQILNHRLQDELAYAKSLGLIEGDDNLSTNSINNKLLDNRYVNIRAEYYKKKGATNPIGQAVIDIIADNLTNSIISINEVERLFSGDPAFYKWKYDEHGVTDISIDKIKRLGALTSTGTNNRLDFEEFDPEYTCAELADFEIGSRQFLDVIQPLFVDSSIREVVKQVHGIEATLNEDGSNKTVEELKKEFPQDAALAKLRAEKEVAGYGEGINVADAAVYVSPKFYEKMMRSIGMWSPEIEEAYRILTNPANDAERNWESVASAYHKIMKASLKPLKYMAFGHRIETYGNTKLAVPYFNKMALFPLFKQVATGEISKLYERMTQEGNEIDMVLFESAVKAGSKNPLPWHDENGNVNDLNKFTTYKQNMKYLRQQLATDPHEHPETMAGTQMLKVALANLDLNGNYGFGENKVKGSEIRDAIFGAMNRLSDIGKARLQERLLDENGDLSEEKLSKMLLEDLETQDSNDNLLEAVQMKDGKMNVSLSAISGNSWLESRIISLINKEVIDVILPGGAFIQRSAFGMIAGSEDVMQQTMINDGKALLTIDLKDGSLQSVVSINLFKSIIPGYDKMTFTEARKWLFDHNVIGSDSGPSAIGYRIPTQAQASISAIKFMDVLPEIMGDTIVLPEEFTKLTGSDFDIDKLYISRYAYDNKGNKIQFDESLGFEGNSEEAIKNKLVQSYLTVLTTTEYTNQLKVSIDNATDTVKSVLKKIESKKDIKYVETFNVYTPQYQEERKSEYTVGKAGIGPFALNNAHHILTLLTNLEFAPNPFTKELDIVNIGKQYDDDGSGRRILDWLSAMINAFVDIAKDPYIVRLNVNPYTYNITSFLLRMGKGEQTFYFLSQPVMKDVADAVLKVRGKYGKDQTKSQFEVEQEATNAVLAKYGITENTLSFQRELLKDDKALAINLKGLFDGELETMLLSDKVSEQAKMDYQAKIWLAFQAFRKYSQDLADLVKYSKVDTKKMGKSFAQEFAFGNGMRDLAEDSNFKRGEVQRFYDETFLTVKAANSIDFGLDTFSGKLLRTSNSFRSIMYDILYSINKEKSQDEKLLKAVTSQMEAFIKLQFFNKIFESKHIDTKKFFLGDNTMAKRLIALNQLIATNPKYSDYKNNALLNYLIPNTVSYEKDFTEPDYIETRTMFQQDVTQQNEIIQAWDEMLSSELEDVRKFANDLVYYSFLTSGDAKNMNSFFEFVPNSWRKESGYSDFVQNILDEDVCFVDRDDFFLNNWTNNALVPRVEYKFTTETNVDNQFVREQKQLFGINSKYVLPGTTKLPYLMFSGRIGTSVKVKPAGYIQTEGFDERTGKHKTITVPKFYPYVKIKYGKTNAPSSYVVYKLIGTEFVKSKTGRLVQSPIYLAVQKKGFKYKGHVITEYGNTHNFPFNYSINPITQNNTTDGTLGNMIYRNNKWGRNLQNAFYKSFVKYNPTFDLNVTTDNLENEPQLFTEPSTINKIYEKNGVNYYEGNIQPEKDVIFVFGSNPEGRHGAGAARVARELFGAIYGIGEGLQGNSYALPTKDLRIKKNKSFRSISKELIINNINRLYEIAKQNPYKKFMIGYRNKSNEISLNGYTGAEMIEMFNEAGVTPNNVFFSKEWMDTGLLNKSFETPLKSTINDFAEEWSKKEGWSVKYFYKNVLPRINEAWLIEFALADANTKITVNSTPTMNFDYNNNKRLDVTSESTIEAIKNSERTATTRYESDSHIDYWKTFKTGDVVKFVKKDSTGKIVDYVIVRITKPLTKLNAPLEVRDELRKAQQLKDSILSKEEQEQLRKDSDKHKEECK